MLTKTITTRKPSWCCQTRAT